MSSAESKSDDLSDVKKEQYAKEVVLMMNKDLRVSRNIRAVWFFEHFDEQFQIDDTSKNWDQKELIICGIIPEGENGKRNVENEKFLLGPDTMITYLADMYKLVYVLDLSPSAFVAVGKKGDLLWNRILPALEASIKKTMQPFILPGSSKKFVPKLQISICVYNSYLALPQDQVLLQGIYLREMKDIDKMLEVIRKKLEILINHQMRHGTSFVSTWSNHKAKLTKSHLKKAAELRRMKYKNYRLINGKFYYDSHRRLRVREEYSSSSEEDEKDKKEEKMRIQYNFKDKGFIRSSWALIFMLRLGLLGTKMMNDNTPSNIIIISDGVCGVPDIKAVQTILTQLRGCTVSCSFIDLQNKNEEDPCFGHMSYPEVFQFFAGATYGTFMYANEINNVRVTDYRNTFHEAFLFWSFQKTIAYENAAEDFVATLSSEYLDFGHKGEFRHRFSFETYTITLRQLLYVRLREGFTLKSVEIDKAYNKENHVKIKKFEIITVVLCQPWKPQITLEYVITTKWMGKITHMSETTVEIYVIAPYKFLVDLFKSSKSDESALSVWNNPFELLRNTIQDILFADKLLLRLHAFMHDNQYIVPHELTDRNNCLFGVEDDELFVMISSREFKKINSNFIKYWKLLCELDETIWQKWMHTYYLRAVLHYDISFPHNLFTKTNEHKSFGCITADNAFDALEDFFKRTCKFVLLERQTFVYFFNFEEQPNVQTPKYFYIVRLSGECPHILIKIAFLGGVCGLIRNQIITELKRKLVQIKVNIESRDIDHVVGVWKEKELLKQAHIDKKNSIEYNSVHDEKNVELFTTDDGPSNLTKSLSTSEESIILNENAGLSPRHIYEETEQIVTTEKRCLEIFEKPTDRILIKHKETPDIYDPLTRDLADEVELWRRKVVITNSLKKYLCCRSSIYQISPCHENIRCIQPNQLEYILHTIIYRRLNQGFSFAYGVDGVVNMVRQATKTMNNDGQSVPCVQQFIIQAPESYKAVLEKELCTNYSKQKVKIQKNETTKETEKKAAYEKFYEEDGSKFDYQLTFEAWTEPDDWTDKKKNKKTNNLNAKYPEEYESPKLIEEVNQIMKVMLTMDVIMTATTNKQMNYNNPLIFPINAIDDTQKKCDPDELYIKKYTDSYDMESLCRHAPERAIILFPCLGKDKNDPDSIDRTKSLLEVLHYEIDKEFDLCIKQPGSEYWHSQLGQVKKILDDEVLDLNLVENSLFEDQVLLKAPFKKKLTRSKSFNDLVEYKDLCKKVNPAFISERQLNLLYLKCDPDEYVPPKRCTRYYARRWSPSSIVLIALPDTIYDILDLNGKAITNKSAIPVCVYYIDESFLTDIMIHEEPKERFSPLIDFRYQRPHDDLSCRLRQMTQKTREEIRKKIVVPWYSNPRIEKLAYSYDVTFDFADFCNNFEEFTYSRAYVLSVYSALCNSKYVPEHVLKHMVEERCQEASREIVEYNEKLRIFCEHFDQNKKDGCVYDSDLHSISYSCVKEKTEFKLNFEHLVSSHNFITFPSLKDYYVFNTQMGNFNHHIADADEEVADDLLSNTSNVLSQPSDNEVDSIAFAASEHFASRRSTFSRRQSISFKPKIEKKRKSKFFKSPNESDSTSSSDENDPTLRNENHRESDTFDGTLDDATFDDDKSEISNVTMELEELKNSKCNNLLTIKTPIFVQLICAITLPNGEMVTFPASSIPNCIMDVLNMAPTEIGFNEMASMIDKIKVTIDMYIFTCPISQDIVRSKNQPYNYFVEDKIIVNQNFQVLNENVNDKKLDVTKIKDLDDEYSYSFGVQEFKILSQLYSDINYFIDSEEYFLMIRRVPKIFKRHELDKITNFTSTFSRGKSSLLDNRLKYSFKESDFVVKQEKILQGMIERFPTFDVEYLRMIGDYDKENDSLVFYCCEIANKERFKNLFKEGYSLYHSDNESLLSESEATREASIQCYSEPIKPTDCDSLIIDKPILDLENTLSSQLRQEYTDPSTNMVDTNFWIMVLFKNNQISYHLLQRCSNRHNDVFEKAKIAVKEKLYIASQGALLEQMYETRIVDTRLLTYKDYSLEYFNQPKIGTYALDVVWYHYFYVNNRLRRSKTQSGTRLNDFRCGVNSICDSLKDLKSDNSKIFIFRQPNGNICLLKLIMSDHIKLEYEKFRPDIIHSGKNNIRNSILLSFYGIDPPAPHVAQDLVEKINEDLEKATLNEFVRVMKINPNYIGLIPEDIHFIQKDHTLPTYKFTCAIPKELYSVINAFRHYLDQHMRNFLAIPKYENLSLYEFAYDFEVLKGENISKSCSNVKAFKSCPNIYDSNEDFARIVSNFYLYAKAYNEEKSELGIAAIEFKFIKAETKKSLTLNDLAKQEVNYHIRELLTENLDSIKAKINLRADSEISNSIIEEISPENGAQIVVLQFNIWETGNINIKEFRRKMNNVVQQSINDIYTEYSVLSRSCFENNTLLEKTPFSSNYSSTACILPPVRQKHVSGYSTLPTYKLQQIPGVNESIVDDYSPFIRKRSASDSYYVSGSLIDPLTLLNLYSEEEIDLSIYYEPVTINNPTTFYENGSDVAVEAEPPIAENREHSNSDDASSSFHIRRSSTINPGSSKRSSTDRDEPVAFRGQRSKTMPSGRRIIETILGTHEASGTFARSAVGNIEEVVENETDNAPTNIEYLNPLFMQNLLEWFDYIDDQPIRDNYSKCYQRTEMDIDSKIVIDSTHKVLEEKVLEAMPQNDFIHCQSINTLSKGNLVPGKLKVLLNEDVKPIYKRFDHGQIERGNENVVSHVSILFNYKLQKDIVKCSRNSKGSITRRIHSSSKSNQALRDMQYLVGLDPFVPRQHMLLIVIRGLKIILYTYNISPDLCISLKQSFVRTIQWHNAKSKMFKVIHLQKLGIYHLSPMVPKKDYSDVYDVFINKNPDALMDLDYPPSLLEIPDYSSYPSSYGKHIFRMFRDSPEIRLAPSNAFAENQYDQYRKLRADISHELLHRFKLQKFYSDVKEGNVEFEENLFKEALQAFKQVHFVYSPMLMFESWRSKIAEIRSFRGMANTSVEDKTAPRQSTNEKHIYKLQYDLANEYRTYLLSLGWSDLRFKYVCEESQLRNFCDSQYDPSKPFSPNIWLTKTCAAGMFMANVFFRKPYFCFYIYMWNCEENIKPTHQASNVMRKAAVFENVENAKLLEEIKIDLIRKSHVHSFTYDFHLRVADKHLIHRNDLIFPDDYSTHLYLHNFLKYYEYRPPCSRNCVYEAIYENKNMKIEATKVWNLIIDHHKTNKDSNVFVLQNGDCMLVQEEEIELCYHKYKYVKILFKVPVKPYRSNQLNLKVYIMLISKSEIFPILEEFEINAPDTIDVEKHWVSTVTFDLPEEIIVEDESEEEPEEPVLDNYGSELIFVTPSQIHITPKPVSNNSEIRITPIRKDPPKSETKNKIRNEDGMFVKNESEENADKKNKDQIDLEYIEIRGRNRRIEYDALNSYEYHNLYCFNENVVSSDEDNEELNIDEEEMELDLNIEDEQEFEEDNSFEFNNDYDYRNYQEQLLQVDYNNFDMLSSRNTRPELIRMKSYSEKQVSKAIQLRPRSRSYTSEAYRHFEHENEQRIPPLLLAQNDIRIYNDNERIDPNACNNTNIFAAKKLLNLSDSRVKYKSYENDINEEDETLDINSITTKEKQKIVIVPRENAAYIHHLQPDQKVLQEALEKRAIKIVELLKQEIGLSEFGLRKNRMWDLATRTRNKMDRKRRRTRNDTNIENGPRRAPTDPLPPITLGEIVYKKMPPDDLVELFDILEKFDVEDENNTNCDMSRLLRLINFENFMNFALQQFDDTHSIYFENNGEYLFIISRNNENLAMIFYLSPEYKLKVYVAFKDIPKYNKYRQKDKAAISEIKCVCDEAINVVMQYHWKCLATDTISGLRF